MSKKRPERPERTARRVEERDARKLVRDRQRLALLSAGGAADHPLVVPSAAVIEGRAEAMPCVQCEGDYRVVEHDSAGAGLRTVRVKCQRCGAPRTLWFRIVDDFPN